MKLFDWIEDKIDDTKYEDAYYAVYRKKEKVRDGVRTVKRTFRNLKKWLPVLMADEQWDAYYMEFVLLHKLKLMEDFYKDEDGVHITDEEVERILSTLTPTREALERLVEGDYIHFPEGKQPTHESVKVINEYGDEVHYLETIYAEDFGKDKVKEVYDKSSRDELRDRQFVYNTIRDHSQGWWD